jgi:hypothetical protein
MLKLSIWTIVQSSHAKAVGFDRHAENDALKLTSFDHDTFQIC